MPKQSMTEQSQKTESDREVYHLSVPRPLSLAFKECCKQNSASPPEMLRELMRILVRQERSVQRQWGENKKGGKTNE